jgi:hypothetical protein
MTEINLYDRTTQFTLLQTITRLVTINPKTKIMSAGEMRASRKVTVRNSVALKLPQASHMSDLWGKLWIITLKNQQIYDSIAQFDPASMTENPYKKVTTIHHNACQQNSLFLNLFSFCTKDTQDFLKQPPQKIPLSCPTSTVGTQNFPSIAIKQ